MSAKTSELPGRRAFGLVHLYVVTLVVAMCSILYELVLAQTLSALLGNTVLRYSVTIGAYLGALGVGSLLCKTSDDGRHEDPRVGLGARLVRVEAALSLAGGVAVPCLFLLDGIQRYFYFSDPSLAGTAVAPVAFLVVSHLFIIAIGVLSGFELPLLLQLGERRRVGATPRVLGVDYLGSLVGAVVFPIVLLPQLGLFASAFVISGLNAVAGLVILWVMRVRRGLSMVVLVATFGVAVLGLASADDIEQRFLQSFYYETDLVDPLTFGVPADLPEVEHHQSAYQAIDLVRAADPMQWQTDVFYSPREPTDLWMFLDGEFQFFSAVEPTYHEWFVHVPIQRLGRVPRRALLLGGGDAMTVRELLRYDGIEEVVHVELDPEMIELSRNHPLVSRLNDPAHRDPRHRMIQDDAFHWLRSNDDRFALILIDMPYPKDHNLSNVYSREFYIEVAKHLQDDGLLVLDAPDGDCQDPSGLWPYYSSTLWAAGFGGIEQYASYLVAAGPRIERLLAAVAEVRYEDDQGVEQEAGGEDAARWWERKVDEAVEAMPVNEFILARRRPEIPLHAWTDHGIELRALGEHNFEAAFVPGCVPERSRDRVNSIFRPTIPPPRLVSLRGPH